MHTDPITITEIVVSIASCLCVCVNIYMIQLLSPRSLSIIIQIVADLPVCASKAEWFLLRVRRPPWPLYNTTHTQYMRTHFSSISHKEKTLRALIHNHPDPKDQPENNSNNNNNNNTQQKQKKERKKPTTAERNVTEKILL